MSHEDCLEIVISSIKAIAPTSHQIKPADKLKDVGINNGQKLGELKDRTHERSEKKTGRRIDYDKFIDEQNYTTGNTVDEAAERVDFGVGAGIEDEPAERRLGPARRPALKRAAKARKPGRRK